MDFYFLFTRNLLEEGKLLQEILPILQAEDHGNCEEWRHHAGLMLKNILDLPVVNREVDIEYEIKKKQSMPVEDSESDSQGQPELSEIPVMNEYINE